MGDNNTPTTPTTPTMLDKVKILLGISDTSMDTLLSLLIDIAKADAVDFCHLVEYAEELDTPVIKMVIQLYNKRGNEGIQSLSFTGVSESYMGDYSDDIIRQLQRHRRLVAL